MRSRTIKWFLAGFCALAMTLAYLAQPPDDFAGLRDFKANEYRTTALIPGPRGGPGSRLDIHTLEITERVATVKSRLILTPIPGFARDDPNQYAVLPSGAKAYFLDRGTERASIPGSTCMISIQTPARPWYVRTWATLKRRLGF